jgi:hypothetical protein
LFIVSRSSSSWQILRLSGARKCCMMTTSSIRCSKTSKKIIHSLTTHGDIAILVCRLVSHMNTNSVCFNSNDSYPRRLIVRTVDESTADPRMAMLMLFRDFMMHPENNPCLWLRISSRSTQ